jgi:hypothetical protein
MSCEYADVISSISDVIVAMSAAAAAIFAYVGLSTWRKQLKGGAEYQLAKDVLKAAYRVREAFDAVRNPAIFEYEYPEEMRSTSGHLREEKKYEGTAHVYEKRWEQMASSFKELEEWHLQAQVEWGPEFQNRIKKLRLCRVELMSAIQNLLEGYKDPGAHATTTPQERREARSVLYSGGGPEFDKFTPQIHEAIDEFEKWLRLKVSK